MLKISKQLVKTWTISLIRSTVCQNMVSNHGQKFDEVANFYSLLNQIFKFFSFESLEEK